MRLVEIDFQNLQRFPTDCSMKHGHYAWGISVIDDAWEDFDDTDHFAACLGRVPFFAPLRLALGFCFL
ncbi:hypothetical protein Pla52n_29130 [Stieleria varia]|uniref:Uncharacterized protein n=1 Tax=Stieleria varia TaxID=2528005 RepID=A0A5C6AYW7_9BACT|nr:hypothetical protein Pla52n_29130 [Stieleria varia]